MKGYLLLQDGTRLDGQLIGAKEKALGELVFNTSMTGYQEILTDPSYHKQIVILTHPEIGNYGCDPAVTESELGHATGMVIRHVSPGIWHRNGEDSFDTFLKKLNVTAIVGLDTRRLTQLVRDKGAQNVMIAPGHFPEVQALEELKAAPPMTGANLVPDVSTPTPRVYGEGDLHVVLLDFGIKASTINALTNRGCRVTQVPWNTTVDEIKSLRPDGIMLSNGPGDPAAVPQVRSVIADLIERYPVMGICMGFQLMALSLGAKTYKMPFGHHGGNHPVKHDGRVQITSQNHGFAVEADSLDDRRVDVTHISLFDGSLEGFALKERPVFGVQFHPEAGPGPHDCLNLFDRFVSLMRGNHA